MPISISLNDIDALALSDPFHKQISRFYVLSWFDSLGDETDACLGIYLQVINLFRSIPVFGPVGRIASIGRIFCLLFSLSVQTRF